MKRFQEILVAVQNLKLFSFKVHNIKYHITSYFKNSEIHIYQKHQYVFIFTSMNLQKFLNI